ncbi:hypothetical protein DFH08DRAFT_871385 [Mycena albidolilacea]|uniref:Ribonuclease H1 N-terminal domain-containing protein n=1 Tax=Mycena albidolilacea TaxID=1033008 RepID=A0AAD6ZY11_9AGAR|nr:hypothetical protein DFH08DRAFT_871385 [Mycena albidolilacea]
MIEHTSDALSDEDFVRLLARLNVQDNDRVTPPPRTPSPPARSLARESPSRTFLAIRPRTFLTTPPTTLPATSAIYNYGTPTAAGYTADWAVAGTATQGVSHSHVRAIQKSSPKKPRIKKHAYVVFAGLQCGVFHTWERTKPLVDRVPNSIFRGYSTVWEAEAAFAYAQMRQWTRVSYAPLASIPALPQPIGSALADEENPLHGTEALDNRWFIVYRGIMPGVYRSHLECQLNTLGIPATLHEAVSGKDNALAKYRAAVARGDVSVITPTYTARNGDPFV